MDSSSSASSFGLPFEEQAQKAAQEGATITKTVQRPEGEAVRVVSVPVSGLAEEVGVVQAAQLRQVAWYTVRCLIFDVVPQLHTGAFRFRAVLSEGESEVELKLV